MRFTDIMQTDSSTFWKVLSLWLRGDAPVALGPGQTFYEGPNDIHTIGRNPSRRTPAKFLVFLIKDKDAPISIPAK